MEYKNALLAGTSVLALLMGASASGRAVGIEGNFVFGISTATVTATVAQSVTTATAAALSSQVNYDLSVNAAVEGNRAVTVTGATVTGGPSTSSLNLMSATAIANQFSNATGNTYVVDPSYAPTGGNATLGTSQLNYNVAGATNIARLGQGSTVVVSTVEITPAVPESTGTYTSASSGTVTFAISGSTWTVTSAPTGSGLAVGDTFTESAGTLTGTSTTLTGLTTSPVVSGSTSSYSAFSTATTSSGTTGSLDFQIQEAPYTAAVSAVTSTASVTVPGTGNAITFTAEAAYGAPVILNNNTFAARIDGNLALSSVVGGVPTGGFAAGPARVMAGGTGSPVGTMITVNAPLSLSNVQQNVADGSETRFTASANNTMVGALFAGASPGFNGGSVTVLGNVVAATAAGNSASVGIDLTGANFPSLGGGVALFSAQGNLGTINGEGTSGALVIEALNNNTTLRIQSQDSAGTLTQINNSIATLASNAITSRVSLNEITAQTLNTATTLAAGGSSGTTTTSQLLSPTNTLVSGGLVNVAADYVNVATQSNLNSVTGTATVTNAVIGAFTGVTDGGVNLQANTVSGTVTGNVAAVSTVMPLVSGAASTLTGVMQSNAGTALNATVSGTQFRISDSSALSFGTSASMDVSSATTGTVSATTTSGASFTNATLNIGSATSAALGNTVRASVFGNQGTASANLGQTASGLENVQATTLFASGLASSSSTTVTAAAPTSVLVVQQNLGLTATAQATHSPDVSGNGLFQIDAYQGLSTATATIGFNGLRSTAVGNFGEASATVSGATSPTLAGGVAVGTFQSNVNSSIGAFLGTEVPFMGSVSTATQSGPVASIGVGALFNSTAQVLNNTFAAAAVGNSASGALTIPAGTVAGGSTTSTPQFTSASSPTGTLSGSYVVGNAQVNAGTTIAASTLSQTSYATTLALSASGSTLSVGAGMSTPFVLAAASILSSGTLSSRMNVGALSFTNSTGLVAGNTVSTAAVGNEYNATVSAFAAAAGVSGSTTTYTSLSVGSTQTNQPSDTGVNTSVMSANIGNNFVVSTASSVAAATGGVSDGTGGTAVNSTLRVADNTASAVATGNSARLVVTDIGTSGAGATTFNATISAGTGGIDQVSTAPVAITNRQTNVYGSDTTGTPAILATSIAQNFGVGFGSGASTTGSTLRVENNAMTATATANAADLSATLAAGSSFLGGVGLNNYQVNEGAVNTWGSSSTTSNTVVQAAVGFGSFSVGVGNSILGGSFFGSSSTSSTSYVENSTVAVSGNRMVASATQNTATLSVTAPASTLMQGGSMPASQTSAGVSGMASADASANIAAVNVQAINGIDTRALAIGGFFVATAEALNSTVAVNANVVEAIARGNTATTTLTVPRIDGTMEAYNAQTASNANLMALTGGVFMQAGTGSSRASTESTAVSVSSNLIAAASTVNNYAATMSGLGQSGAGSITQANAALSVPAGSTATVTHNAGDLTLASSQFVSASSNMAIVTGVAIGANLANNLTSASPITLNANTVAASANGNVAAQTILANAAGGSNGRSGIGNYAVQGFGTEGSTSTVSSAQVYGASISVQTGSASGASSAGVMVNSPVSISGNSVTASAVANSAALSTLFSGDLLSSGSGSASTVTVDNKGTAVSADYSLASMQTMIGSSGATRSEAFIVGTTISANLGNASTTSSPLNIGNNTVTATANGNVSALSMLSNASGATNLGGSALASNQTMAGSSVSAGNFGATISANMNGNSLAPETYMLTNSPVTINGNTVGTSASGNSASLNSGFASATRSTGAGGSASGSTTGADGASAYADYVLLNTQRAGASQVSASTAGASITFAGAATNSPVSVQNNNVFATAFGNSATLAMSGVQAGGSVQSTNYQQTNNTVVSASVVGTNIGAAMGSVASSRSPVNVSGNSIRAVAVGNSVTNAVGR